MLHLRAARIGPRGQTLLQDIELQLSQGERVVILGASGAGKTTLLGALYQLAGRRAALIPQPHGLVGPLTVAHNIALGRIDQQPLWRNLRSLIWMPRRERAAVAEQAQALDLEPQLDQAVDSLSGGEQSRTAIARALYRGGPLLLADEPCAALDPERARLALSALQNRFATLVCSMHDVDAGLALATRVIGVAQRRIAFDLPVADVDQTRLDALYAGQPADKQPVLIDQAPALPRGCL